MTHSPTRTHRAARQLLASALLLASMTGSALAQCVLTPSVTSPQQVAAGSVQQFEVVASGPSCASATLTVFEASDTTDTAPGSVLLSSATGSAPSVAPFFPVTVQLASRGGGSVVYDVTCNSGCVNTVTPQFSFTYNVDDVVRFELLSPPEGGAMVQGGTMYPLTALLLKNGSASNLTAAEGQVCFEFTSPPANGSSLSGGAGACGAGGRLAQIDANGEAGVTLNAGDTGPIDGESLSLSATAVNLPSVPVRNFTVFALDTFSIEIVSGDGQIVAPGATFQSLTIRTLRNGAVEPNLAIDWQPIAADATYQGATPTASDGSGLSSVVVQAGVTGGPIAVRVCAANTGCVINAEFALTATNNPVMIDISPPATDYFITQPYEFRVRLLENGVAVPDGTTVTFTPDLVSCPNTAVNLSTASTTTAGGEASTFVTPTTLAGHCVEARWDAGVPGDPGDDATALFSFNSRNFYEVIAVSPGAQTVAVNDPVTLTVRAELNGNPATLDPQASMTFSQLGGPAIAGLPAVQSMPNGAGEFAFSFNAASAGVHVVSATYNRNLAKASSGNTPIDLQLTVTVQNTLVSQPDDFSGTPINGFSGGQTTSVYANDTFNGAALSAASVTASITSDGGLSGVSINSNGEIVVPAGTSANAGYVVSYQVCDAAAPTNCSTGSVTLAVTAAPLVAANDDFSNSPIAGAGGGNTPTVLGNDTLNGAAVNSADVIGSISSDGGLTGVGINPTGQLVVPPGTGAGVYPVAYQICDVLNPVTNCASATAAVTVTALLRTLVKPGAGSGDAQSALPGAALAQPLVAVALDNGSAPPSPVTINWSVSPVGAATVAPSPSSTIADGSTSVSVTLSASAVPGVPVTITATRADDATDPEVYTVTVLAPAVTSTLVKPATGSGDGQSAAPGAALPQPLVAIALDNGAAPASPRTINWSVSPVGAGTVSPATSSTIADGSTSVSVTLSASAVPGVPVTITATRADAPAASTSYVVTVAAVEPVEELTIIRGDGQRGLPGQPAQTLSVLYTVDGFPVPGEQVNWTVSGPATPSSGTSNTSASGVATFDLTFGNAPGVVTVTATAGTASVQFTLEAVGPTLRIVSGNNQSGLAGSTLGAPLVVEVLAPGAGVLANIPVTWTVVSGGGAVSQSVIRTDASGRAGNTFTLGGTAGLQEVRASIDGGAVTFSATAQSTGFALVSGGNQRGPVQTRADAPIVIAVAGGGAGQILRWQVIEGSAVLDQADTTTDADGRSQQGFRFGNTAGPVHIRVTLAGSGLALDVFATSYVPSLRIVSGDGQAGPASAPLPQPLVVAISDPGIGKTLAGVTIQWTVSEGNGTLTSSTTQTDASGHSSNALTLGSNAGAHRVTASVIGGNSVTFTATGSALAGALRIVSGNNQQLETRTPSDPLVVELVDGNNRPVQGATLQWSGDNASLTQATTTTDTTGRSSNVAQLLIPGAATVTARLANTETRVTFAIQGGVAEIPRLSRREADVADLIDALCPALAVRSGLTPEEADLLARCLELVRNAGDHPEEVQEALQELVTDIARTLTHAALDTLRTQLGNHSTRFEALRRQRLGAGTNNQFGMSLMTPGGMVPLSFLPSVLLQAEGEDGEGGGEIGADFSRWGFFATGTIGRGEASADSLSAEYDFDTSGLTAGVDYRFNDRFVGGVSLGYARHDTQLSNDAGSLDTSGWTVSGYATWFNEQSWYVDGVLSYGSNSYDLLRRIRYQITGVTGGRTTVDQRASASTDGSQIGAAVTLGRDFQRGAWNYSTYFRGDYGRTSFNGYVERAIAGQPGAGLVLAVEPRDLKTMAATLGGKVTYVMSRDWGILMPNAQIELQHEFEDDPQALATRFAFDPTSTVAVGRGQEIDSDLVNMGLGLSALFPGGRSAYLYYERLMASDRISQDTLSVGVRMEF